MPWRVFRYVIKVGAQERGTIVNSEVSIYWPELLLGLCSETFTKHSHADNDR